MPNRLEATRRPRHPRLLALLVAALLLPFAVGAAPVAHAADLAVPDVVSVAPADADVIVVVPNLARSSKRIGDFAAAIGAKDMLGNIDPLLAVKQMLGIEKGLDDTGSAMIVAYDLVGMVREKAKPPFVLVLPISDYKTFLSNFKSKHVNGVDEITTQFDTPVFARSVGKFAVVGIDRDRLAAYKPGDGKNSIVKSLGALGTKVMASNDASIYINFKSLSAAMKPEMKKALDDFERQIGSMEQAGGIAGEVAGVGKWIGMTFFDTVSGVLRDGESVVLGADLGGDGVGISMAIQFQEGSKLARRFSGAKTDAAAMLAEIPTGPYLFAFSADFAGVDMKGIVDDLLTHMPKAGMITSTMRDSIEFLAVQKRTSMAYYTGPQGIMGGFSSVTVVDPVDPKAYMKMSKASIENMSKVKIEVGEDEEGRPLTVGFTTEFKENVHEVEGVPVSHYLIKTNLPKALINQIGPAAGMMVQMGLTQQSGYMADVNGHVIQTSKPELELIAKAIKAVKDGKGLGATGMIPKVRKAGVPEGSMLESYVNVGAIVEMINPFMAFLEMDAIDVPKNLPPLALAGQAEDGGVGAKLFMPMPMVNWIKEIVVSNQSSGGPGPRRDPSKGPPEAPF